ncbi:Lipocalin [Liparis tanakae]|uniref:Lipocalin n=1 Tax=Liparis tanakae TaxID=230148 RepID=A0A4Z2EYU8_9TELE|nr:Lipocalin [Liparis tanakae]
MLGLLGALMFVLAACAKMAGKWYIVGLASNAKWFVNNKAVMETSTAMLEPTGGDLNLTYANLKRACRRSSPSSTVSLDQPLHQGKAHDVECRTTEVTLVLQQKFIQFSLENGAHADNVLILPHNGECPQV